MSKTPETTRFDFLDGMRGVAVLTVMLHHCSYRINERPVFLEWLGYFQDRHQLWAVGCATFLYNLYRQVAFFGDRGVDVFFVISGFLITGLLIDFLDGRVNILRFFTRRAFKILPHYYFVIVVTMLVAYGISRDLGGVFRSYVSFFLFLQNYWQGADILQHTWSLVIEEQFYLFWAVLLFMVSRFVLGRDRRLRVAVAAGCLMILLVVVCRYYYYASGSVLFSVLPKAVSPIQMTLLRLDALMAGCIFRLILVRSGVIARDRLTGVVLYLLGALLMGSVFLNPLNSYGIPSYWFTLNLTWMATVLLILAGLKGFSPVFGNGLIRYVGKNSYGIYLVHYPFLFFYIYLFKGTGIKMPVVFTVLYLVSAVAVGCLTTITVERYFLSLRKKLVP